MQDLDDDLDAAEVLGLLVGEDEAGTRLDVALAEAAKARGFVLSRTRIKGLIETGCATIDAAAATDANRKLKDGEAVTLVVPAAVEAEPQGEAIALAILYEDAHLIVIDKPAGLVVHPAPGHATGTLVNALIAHCGDSLSGIGGVKRPGIVHRLDKDTSGVLVVAKTDAAHRGLAALFADHGRSLPLQRTYNAFVWGRPDRAIGTVDLAIGRHPADRLRMAVVAECRGRKAVTHWRLAEAFGEDASLLTCQLETGRTHQIRVHMAHIGHPVMGDPLYARGFATKTRRLAPEAQTALDALRRQALHASVLGFAHPVTGALLEFESPLPSDLRRLEAALRGPPRTAIA